MSQVKPYPHGTFSWADLSSNDAAVALPFYKALFGWTSVDNPLPGGGVYTMLSKDGKNVCGLSQASQEMMDMGMPSVWSSYITVDDVEAVTDRVVDLGGKVTMGAFDVMDAGRMSVIQDPSGAFVSLWETVNHKGADAFNIPGTMGWNELATRDPEAAAQFFSELLGWTSETDPNGYVMYLNGGRPNGGMMRMDENWPPDVPPHWTVYFSVEDIDASATKLKDLGGQIMMGPFDGGEVGKIAICAGPTGETFNIIQLNQADGPIPGHE